MSADDVTAYRRIILDLYQGFANRRTMAQAAELARLLRLDLLGIFVEDEAVHGLAGLPFARELRLPSHEWVLVDADRVAADFRHAAMTARRMLAETAGTLGVASVFQTMRGDPAAAITELLQASDIIVLAEPRTHGELLTGALAQSWRAALGSAASVLLMPPKVTRQRGPVAVLVADQEDRGLITAARIALAADETLLILLTGSDETLRESAIRTARTVGLPPGRVRTHIIAGTSAQSIVQGLAWAEERLFVLSCDALRQEHAENMTRIVAARGIPVLLVACPGG
jgi:hypothetical protein